MRNKRWLRLGLASVSIVGGALGAFLVACGDDDNGSSSGGLPDGSTSDVTAQDQNVPDTNVPEAAASPAKIIGVNAISDLTNSTSDSVRVCFGLGPAENMAPPTSLLPPLPDRAPPGVPFPAIFVGTGGILSGTGAPIGAFFLVPYLMNAETIAAKGILPPGNGTPGTTCAQALLQDAGGLVANVDYWRLPAIAPGVLADGTTKLLVVSGCSGDSPTNPLCGPGFAQGAPGVGTLAINVFNLDRTTTIAAGSLGAQFVNASPSIEAVLGATNVKPGITNDAGGNFQAFAAADAAVALRTLTPLVQIPNANVNGDHLVMNPVSLTALVSLKRTEAISFAGTGGDAGTMAYATGKSFTFIAIGNPAEPVDAGGGQFNTKTFHYLGFPNDPVVSTYAPPAP